MSEFRKNPLTGDLTLYAENRKNRPYEFVHHTKMKTGTGENCPFCGGHEGWTTEAVYQDGADADWQIRVFPNMFPAVSEENREAGSETFYEQQAGIGRHEVVVDTREHLETIDTFSEERIDRILAVLQERSHALQEEHTAYVQIFKNCGPSAGMSIRHSHWQLIGLPLVPKRIGNMAEKMKQADCLFCKMLLHEQKEKIRIASETKDFLAITPYASRFPYEVWIAPKLHRRSFCEMTPKERKDLTHILWALLQRIVGIREEIGYNICIIDGPKNEDFHWHIEILPRIGGFAGFEYATECYINMVLPEKAAEYYRDKK
ncbi:MAG: DUF4931 domain-containing protein [Anaerotignum sp.]|nr:DUF4931 domain-containing protein [Anaerotignum sp.]